MHAHGTGSVRLSRSAFFREPFLCPLPSVYLTLDHMPVFGWFTDLPGMDNGKKRRTSPRLRARYVGPLLSSMHTGAHEYLNSGSDAYHVGIHRTTRFT